jgi:hypothetical protein
MTLCAKCGNDHDRIKSLHDEIVDSLASGTVRKRDYLVGQAIDRALGTTNWELSDLLGRLSSVRFGNEMADHVYLDGKLILKMTPPSMTFDGVTVSMTFMAGMPEPTT